MRIAVFYNLNFGGAKRAKYEHVKGLKKLGHFVDVYTTDPFTDAFDSSKIADNFYYYKYQQIEDRYPFLSRALNDLKTFLILPRLHKKIAGEIDKKKYDIVLVHPDKITQSPFLLRYLKTKNAYYCQEPLRIVYEYMLRANKNIGIIKLIYEQITRNIRKNIDVKNVRSASFTIASCFHVRERMIESYGVYPSVSYLGIDVEVFRPFNVRRKNQVFFVGDKNVWNDGYDLAEKAVKLIPKSKRPNIKVVAWKKSNNERLTDTELVREYNQSIATLCLSRLETFGLVPLESMSCGTPVIATNISGHRETVINNKTGILAEFDALEIKDKLLEIINNQTLSRALTVEARKEMEKNWNWDKRIKEFEKLLIKKTHER